MKITNKIISLMLSVQVAVTSVFAGPVFSQRQPNLKAEATVPLGSKDKKNIDAKTMAKKIALFPPKALWWFIKQNLASLGIGLLDIGILASIYVTKKVIKKTIDYKRVPSEENCRVLCEDMCCCLKKLDKPVKELSGLNISPEIEQAYEGLTKKFAIVEEFLSHYKISMYKYYGILEELVTAGAGNKMCCNEDFEMYRGNKSFKHAGNGLKKIVEKFYRQCSLSIAADKNPKHQGRATEVQQKLNAWKDTMYAILEK